MLPGSTFLIKQYNSLRQRTVVASSDRLVIRVKQNLCEEIGRDIFWGVFFFPLGGILELYKSNPEVVNF